MFSKEFKDVMDELKERNGLYKAVIEDIADEADMDDENLLAVLGDVTRHGCISGCIPSMIDYEDTVKFYDTHKHDINEELAYMLAQTELSMGEFFNNFDGEDPLCLDIHNQNILAWFGFEHVCNDLLDELENI